MPLTFRILACAIPIAAVAASAQPPRRAHHALVYDDARARVILTGGSTPLDSGSRFEFFDDVWEFDGARWASRAVAGAKLSGVALAFDRDHSRVVSYGGYNRSSIADVRALATDKWEPLPGGAPPASEPGFIYDAARKRFVAFGGSAGRGVANGGTWEFDWARWTELSVADPPARMAHVMVYDAARGRTVVFGGMGVAAPGQPPPPLGDTWEFDGARWTRVATDGPSPRFSAGAAYDAKRGVVLVFGGLDAQGFRGDTWAWNGTRWSKLAEAGPSARAMGYLAYDKARDRTVMFGGRTGWPDGDMGDTWEWDGTSWRQISLTPR
jgi:hypothetical protein